jgi:polyketide biosynthesis 3-hydroxy-3-methylglutaryl-CoA synthase-like enzyme PksG
MVDRAHNPAGIEAINVFGGTASVDVRRLAEHRGLDLRRFANLLIKEKAVALPHEDPVTFGANAAWPILESMTEIERSRIELLISCTESGIDFSKSLSTYLHQHLGLSRNCRLFEIKQACYSGTAGLQMAINFVLSGTSPGAKALVIATDITRTSVPAGTDIGGTTWAYAEPTGGSGAVALLVGAGCEVFQMDTGASGYYGYEVMDACRPAADEDAGDADLSLMSYMDCCEQSFSEYERRVRGADFRSSFHYLAFHTPFGGMVKGAHRALMRKTGAAGAHEIEADFEHRVRPSLEYCQQVGNIMSGTVFLALAGAIDHGSFPEARRVGCFSYGSGCCSEFYSGVVRPGSQRVQRQFDIAAHLHRRYRLSINEYEDILRHNAELEFHASKLELDKQRPFHQDSVRGTKQLELVGIRNYHREYRWV